MAGGLELEVVRALIEVLPADARLNRIYENPCESSSSWIITSADFPPHDECDPLPELKVKFTKQISGAITAELLSLGDNGLDRALPRLYRRKLTD